MSTRSLTILSLIVSGLVLTSSHPQKEDDTSQVVEEEEVLVVEMEGMDEVFGVAVVVAALEEVTEDHMDVGEGVLEEEEGGLGHSSSVTLICLLVIPILFKKIVSEQNLLFFLP